MLNNEILFSKDVYRHRKHGLLNDIFYWRQSVFDPPCLLYQVPTDLKERYILYIVFIYCIYSYSIQEHHLTCSYSCLREVIQTCILKTGFVALKWEWAISGGRCITLIVFTHLQECSTGPKSRGIIILNLYTVNCFILIRNHQ